MTAPSCQHERARWVRGYSAVWCPACGALGSVNVGSPADETAALLSDELHIEWRTIHGVRLWATWEAPSALG